MAFGHHEFRRRILLQGRHRGRHDKCRAGRATFLAEGQRDATVEKSMNVRSLSVELVEAGEMCRQTFERGTLARL